MVKILFSWYGRPDNRDVISALLSDAAHAGAHVIPTDKARAFDDCYEYRADQAALSYVRRHLRAINRYGLRVNFQRVTW